MTTINCIENFIDKNFNHYSSFLIQPLEKGQGITLGNSLRRTLLSDLTGFSATAVKINNLAHEFASISGIREDVLEILLNIREIIFKPVFNTHLDRETRSIVYSFLHIKGPILVTAGMLKLPKNTLEIINPNLHICSLTTDSDFFLEIKIESGKGAILNSQEKKQMDIKVGQTSNPLLLDSIYSPIKRANYQIRIIYDSKGNLKESLVFEILTNGSITPKRALQESIKILLTLFYPLVTKSLFEKFSKILKGKIIKRLQKKLTKNF
jgi:DNA-directed RNA polymerase subunit alpha|uniref:Alpha subunit of RNA polymerase n=1 Tax=Poterioochromonas malhamensis TaxID=88167 RepID=A0A7T6Y7G3_9STRA|nr:alpha subunit of RNA polymerase [Poterioochromonas malhamensis]QQK54983.1 alpha subunit of RNA polymerase [Poterioochromonas malhamensis]